MRLFFLKVLCLVTGTLLLFACAAVYEPAQEFKGAHQDFRQRLRWADHSGAARHIAPEFREAFLQLFAGLPDLHPVDVRVESVEFQDEGRRAETWTVLEYYLLPSLTVKKFRFRQEWAYVGGDRLHPGAWVITTPFPSFP